MQMIYLPRELVQREWISTSQLQDLDLLCMHFVFFMSCLFQREPCQVCHGWRIGNSYVFFLNWQYGRWQGKNLLSAMPIHTHILEKALSP